MTRFKKRVKICWFHSVAASCWCPHHKILQRPREQRVSKLVRFREDKAVGDCQTKHSSSGVPVIMEWWEHSRDTRKGPMALVLFIFAVL